MSKHSAGSAGVLDFLKHEASGGIALMLAAALALVVSNTVLAPIYDRLFDTPVSVRVGALALDKPLLLWINDGLMAIFFCLVGLEIKRELLAGELSGLERALLPAVAAIGGMAAPAAIYIAVNWSNPLALKGWAIPAATDIAFAVAVLAVLGGRVPVALKVFLLALAIIDDLGAIIIIAVFYTADLSLLALLLAAVGTAMLVLLNLAGVTRITPYVLVGFAVWVCVLKSGIHATLAGVLVGLAIPLRSAEGQSPLETLQHNLHPWVAFGVLPLFGFANAGVSLAGVTLDTLFSSVPLGIMLGLLIGKPVGVLGASWLVIRAGWCRMPEGTTWPMIAGAGMLAGIGFTMSLFIAMLAFPEPEFAGQLRIGVLVGSVIAAMAGYVWLRRCLPQQQA